MNFKSTKFKGLFIIEPTLINDKRGYFHIVYDEKTIAKYFKNIKFIQENESYSKRGVVRGFHFQRPPFAQAKLVRCIKGCIIDIAIDIRKGSLTYGEIHRIELSCENKRQLFVPRGFAHGFIVTSKTATVVYKVDNLYSKEHETGIYWNDKRLNVDWGVNINHVIVSEKDEKLPPFSDLDSPFNFKE